MTGCARREEVFLEEMDSDEENSNRKAGEESTAYENNVAAGEITESTRSYSQLLHWDLMQRHICQRLSAVH